MFSKIYTTRIWFVGDIGGASIEFDTVLFGKPAESDKDEIFGRLAAEAARKFPSAERIHVTVG